MRAYDFVKMRTSILVSYCPVFPKVCTVLDICFILQIPERNCDSVFE